MLLNKIYFEAFKSLLKKELEITQNCIGFVGVNESGKSNVLEAIRVLGDERKLEMSDTPRMAKENHPKLIFQFGLSAEENKSLEKVIKNILKEYVEIENELLPANINIKYNVIYDRNENKEKRYFDLPEIKLDKNYYYLIPSKTVNEYQVKTENGYKELNESIIITKKEIKLTEEIEKKAEELHEYDMKLINIKRELESTTITDENNKDDNNGQKEIVENKYIAEKNAEMNKIIDKINTLKEELKDYRNIELLKNVQKDIEEYQTTINSETVNKQDLLEKINTLENSQNEAQNKQLIDFRNKLKKVEQSITIIQQKLNTANKKYELLNEKITTKYSDDKSLVYEYIKEPITEYLKSILPNVIYWKYNDNYLLSSEVAFDEILSKNSISDISRPLFNVFRIGLGINTIDELKNKIIETQEESNERSRISKKLTTGINAFLKSIWKDYNQDLSITLEKERLRVEVFDPKKEDASYYAMIERSQGCQTFISFLMTIGAEAKHGVLENTVLLLDEPETHLHPSGAKYMLEELIKIASNNIVLFATHSIFMIDRKNYNRHIILKKENELTEIKPAFSDRIGYFMQEEVLYTALDINLNKDFDSTNINNFVFEGDGDAYLFEYFYNNILNKTEIPFKKEESNFYHGGKCNDIQHYLISKPIQLGTKWIFILDSDKPADALRKFIEGKYKKYTESDIFIYQYHSESIRNAELEDILPNEVKKNAYRKMFEETNAKMINDEEYESILKSNENFSEQFNHICTVSGLEKEKVKGIYKNILNKKIKEDIESNKKEIKNNYDNYYKWISEVTKNIKELLKNNK